jgi:Ni2+-binding GTPase involved in maturation of urease and hydrogenase
MELIAALADICKTSDQPIIAIDGPAGAGKTTLAATLSLALAKEFTITVIHMDDLYAGWDDALGKALTDSLTWITSSHKAKRDLIFTPFNWLQNNFDPPHHCASTSLLILEGVGSSQVAVVEFLSTSIWIDLDPIAGFQRVIERDGDQISESMTGWLDHQGQHFARDRTKERSEFILST